ncbi:MAG: hypothetical protein GF398_10420 [Chitinivibrionales bacterium]|nr:hypothetical protein [Chitinivibrionales bacterium]
MPNQIEPHSITPKQAQILARAFGAVFNSANFYGADHPTTQKFAGEFCAQINNCFGNTAMITLLEQGDSLYFERHRIDDYFKPKRIIAAYERIGIESTTFSPGVSEQELQHFTGLLNAGNTVSSINTMTSEMQRLGLQHIRINYVLLKRVTADEEIIDKESQAEEAKKANRSGQEITDAREMLKENALKKVDKLFLLKDLVDNPDQIAEDIVSSSVNDSHEDVDNVVKRLRQFNTQIAEGSDEQSFNSINEMMEAVYKLKMQLHESLDLQRRMGKFIKEEGPIVDEIENLSFNVIVRLVKEEYQQGKIDITRLTHIIRRLVPDLTELKRILPLLKDTLIKEGMPLADFLELVKALNNDLENESLVQVLEESSDQMGMSVSDIIGAIKKSPSEAARLIVLASEIKQNTANDDSQLSGLLTDYIENVSGQMALAEVNKESGEKSTLNGVITRIQQELLDKVKQRGLSDALAGQVENELAGRFDKAISKIKNNWVTDMVGEGVESTGSYLAKLVDSIVDQEVDVQGVKDPFEKALREKGYSQEEIGSLFNDLLTRVSDKKAMKPLPASVLNGNNILFFLQREIKMFLRFGNPFSTFIITMVGQKTAGAAAPITRTTWNMLKYETFELLERELLDVDLLGTVGEQDRPVPIILKPMIDKNDAEAFRTLLANRFATTEFFIEYQRISLIPAITSVSSSELPNRNVMKYLDAAKHLHMQAEAQIRGDFAPAQGGNGDSANGS